MGGVQQNTRRQAEREIRINELKTRQRNSTNQNNNNKKSENSLKDLRKTSSRLMFALKGAQKIQT